MKALLRWIPLLGLASCGQVAEYLGSTGTCSGSSLVGTWMSGSRSVEFTRDCQVVANVNLIGCSQNNLTYVFTAASSGTVELTCPVSTATSHCTFSVEGTSPLKELSLTCGGLGDATYEESVSL